MFKVAFWMKKHLSLTWKRTWMWSPSRLIEELDLGALSPSEKTCEVRTAKTWVDSKGKKRWQGTRELKGTQQLDYMVRLVFNVFLLVLFSISCIFGIISYHETPDLIGDIHGALLGIWFSFSQE